MTFYLTCSQGQQRSAVMMDVTVVQVMGPATPIVQAARLNTSVAARYSKVYVLNILQYDSDSISYFFVVLTPCKWIVFTVTQ